MTRFKTKEEFQKFCDESQVCLCGKLMTGFHEMSCPRVKKEWARLHMKQLPNSEVSNGK